MKKSLLKNLTNEIVKVFHNRSGFDDWWDNLDPEFRIEIKAELTTLLYNGIKELILDDTPA